MNIKSCIAIKNVLCLVASCYCYCIQLSYDTRLVSLCDCGNVLKSFIVLWTVPFTPLHKMSTQQLNSFIFWRKRCPMTVLSSVSPDNSVRLSKCGGGMGNWFRPLSSFGFLHRLACCLCSHSLDEYCMHIQGDWICTSASTGIKSVTLYIGAAQGGNRVY
jgi:hypothetical protein